MKNKLRLQPKVSNKVSVKSTLVYASIGAGIFILLFTGAFFYFNLGSSEDSFAAAGDINNSEQTGNWGDASIWDLGTIPQSGEEIIITADQIITVSNNVTLNNVIIKVYGTLRFTNGKLKLDENSQIIVAEEGEIVSDGPGNSDQLQIGSFSWKGTDIDAIMSPSQLTTNGESNENLLPIVLDYFKADLTARNNVLVEWGTVTEKENDFFTLERSSDGKTFEELTVVDGAGNSHAKLGYSFEDKNSSAGMNYYRLKQTDFNGDFEYFKIIGVNNLAGGSAKVESTENIQIRSAWPNPFKDRINLSFTAEGEGVVEVLIQNSRGEFVAKEQFSYHYGENTFTFERADVLTPGVYYINLWSNGKKFKPQRLIKI